MEKLAFILIAVGLFAIVVFLYNIKSCIAQQEKKDARKQSVKTLEWLLSREDLSGWKATEYSRSEIKFSATVVKLCLDKEKYGGIVLKVKDVDCFDESLKEEAEEHNRCFNGRRNYLRRMEAYCSMSPAEASTTLNEEQAQELRKVYSGMFGSNFRFRNPDDVLVIVAGDSSDSAYYRLIHHSGSEIVLEEQKSKV